MLEGRCTCGEVRYRLAERPFAVHCCHCRDCQRETGSGFAINALIERDRLELLSGSPESVQTPSASGKGQDVRRCPICSVALWSHYAGAGEAIAFVRAGTLDDAAAIRPDVHIYTRSKLPWVRIPEGVPAVEEYYSPKQLWPAESQARFKATRG